jgi:hypothetical protein
VPGDIYGNIHDDHHRSIDDIDHDRVVNSAGRAADRALWQRGPYDGELRPDDAPRQHFDIPNRIWGSALEIEWREPGRQH